MPTASLPNNGLLMAMPSIIDSVAPPRLPRTRSAGVVLRCSSASDTTEVFCGTSVKPCCSASTPAMLVTGSDVICSAVTVVREPTCPRSTSGATSACTVMAANVWFDERSLKFCSRVASMAIVTFVAVTLWKPRRRA